ncbi:MAG TPA: metallophosphoesterase family protein, partial [Candidatus Saccharimonadales bacterium]|nr:metallophosphoesterase family protein [Candidatus Saccharimonadales bacterium]
MNLKFLFACLFAGFLPLLAGASQHKHEDELETNPSGFLRAPYVQLATPHSMYVVWRTETSNVPVVRFGKTVDNLDGVISGKAITIASGETNKNHKLPPGVRRLHSAPQNCWQYEALISGLEPASLYYYAVYNGDKRLTVADASYHFRTQPFAGSDTPARFWVVGDSGTGRESQSSIQAAMASYIAKDNHLLDFYIHVGDMAYNRGRDAEFQSRFFEVYDSTLRNVVCWTVMGNHEGITSKGTNG